MPTQLQPAPARWMRDAWLAARRSEPNEPVEPVITAVVRGFIRAHPPVDSLHLSADAIGDAYEALLSLVSSGAPRPLRKSRGIYYTPPAIADWILSHTLAPVAARALAGASDAPLDALRAIRVCDPSCGCGIFLLRALRLLTDLALNADPAAAHAGRSATSLALAPCLLACDIDANALALCRLALAHECAAPLDRAAPRLLHTDSLTDKSLASLEGSLDVVVGNPPFLSQLARNTAISRRRAAELRDRFDGAIAPYTDPAAAFLLLATRLLRPGGMASMLQPQSTLAARDAARVRDEISRRARLRRLWIAADRHFDAGVLVWAPVLEAGAGPAPAVPHTGRNFVPRAARSSPAAARSWADIAADALDVPDPCLPPGAALADIADLTAGFRDEFYAIARAVTDSPSTIPSPDTRRVITSGMLGLASLSWGLRPARILRRAFLRPVLVEPIPDDAFAWIAAQRRAKVLIATQSRVIEAWTDESGDSVAITPVILALPRDPAKLWLLAAAIASPVASALVARRAVGAALSAHAIKPSASLLRTLPVPSDPDAWHAAAASFRDAHHAAPDARRRIISDAFAPRAVDAYALAPDERDRVLTWWTDRFSRDAT